MASPGADAFWPSSKLAGWCGGETAGVIGRLSVPRSVPPELALSAKSLITISTPFGVGVVVSSASPLASRSQPRGAPGAVKVSVSTVTMNVCAAPSRF